MRGLLEYVFGHLNSRKAHHPFQTPEPATQFFKFFRVDQSWLVGTPRCAVPTFSEPPSLTDYIFGWDYFGKH
jgi:hypothetical protein